MVFVAKRLCIIPCIFLILTACQTSQALDHAFRNLDFEDAMPVVTGDPYADAFQYATDVLPHWTVRNVFSFAGSPEGNTAVYYNSIGHIGNRPTIFNVFDSGFNPENFGTGIFAGVGPIEGEFSLAIDTRFDNGELFQTGFVQPFSKSVRFFGSFATSPTGFPDGPTGEVVNGSFDLYLEGIKLNLINLGSVGSVNEYGANIPLQFAGTTSELKLWLGPHSLLLIDDIYFSATPVPEPSSLILASFGAVVAVAFLARRMRFAVSTHSY